MNHMVARDGTRDGRVYTLGSLYGSGPGRLVGKVMGTPSPSGGEVVYLLLTVKGAKAS